MQVMLALLLSLIIFSSHAVCLLARAHAPANFIVLSVGACASASNLASLIVLVALATLYGVKGIDAAPCVCAMALHLTLLALWPHLSSGHAQEAPPARKALLTTHDPFNTPKAPLPHFTTPTRPSTADATTHQHRTSAPTAPAPSSPFNEAMSNMTAWFKRKAADYMPPTGSTTIYGAIIGGSNNTVNIGHPDGATRAPVGGLQQTAPHQASALAQPPSTPPPVKVSFERAGLFNREPPTPPAAPPPPKGDSNNAGGNRGSGGGDSAGNGTGPTRAVATVYANSDASTVHLVPNATPLALPVGFIPIRQSAATTSSTTSMNERYEGLQGIMAAIMAFGAKTFSTVFQPRAAICTLGRNFCPAAAILLSLGLDDINTFNMKIFFTALIAMANALLSLNDEQLFNFLSAARSFSTMGTGPSRPHFSANHQADSEGRPSCGHVRQLLRKFVSNYSFTMTSEGNFTTEGRKPADEGHMDIFMLLLCACLHQINFGAVIFSYRNPDGTHNFSTHASLGSSSKPWTSFICHTLGHFTATLQSKALFDWVRKGTYRPPALTVQIARRLQEIANKPAVATTITNSILGYISRGTYKIINMSRPPTPTGAPSIVASDSGTHVSVPDSSATSLSASASTFSPGSSTSSGAESLESLGPDEVREDEASAPLGPRRGGTATTQPGSAPVPSATPVPAPSAQDAAEPAPTAPVARGLNLGMGAATRPPSRPPSRSTTPAAHARAAPAGTPSRTSARIAEAALKGGASNL